MPDPDQPPAPPSPPDIPPEDLGLPTPPSPGRIPPPHLPPAPDPDRAAGREDEAADD